MIPNNNIVSMNDIGLGAFIGLVYEGVTRQPLIEGWMGAAIEMVQVVASGQQLDGRQRSHAIHLSSFEYARLAKELTELWFLLDWPIEGG